MTAVDLPRRARQTAPDEWLDAAMRLERARQQVGATRRRTARPDTMDPTEVEARLVSLAHEAAVQQAARQPKDQG